MTRVLVVRYLALSVPLGALALAAWRTRPDKRARGAALLAFIAAAVGIAALNAVAMRCGWWSYQSAEGTHLGVPVDLWLGWAVLWGALPVLVRLPLPMVLAGLLWLDVLAMPRLEPLVTLGPYWPVGEAVGLAVVATPAVLLGRWAADRRRLAARASLQVATFAGMALWLGPATAVDLGDGSWRALIELDRWRFSLLLQVAALIALPGILAVREFVERGGGTPYPWDPPSRLVTTGPYAYVTNPMQMSGAGLLLLAAVATRSWSVAAAAGFAAAFSAAVAAPHEHDDLTRRHGAAWATYRGHVRSWWPRWRPYIATPALLHLADTCYVCSSTATALTGLHPIGLVLRPAEFHAEALSRASYEGAHGYRADGVAAVARGLEHVNLGWAVVGWVLRVPLLDRLAQVIVDGLVQPGPRLGRPPAKGASGWPAPGRD